MNYLKAFLLLIIGALIGILIFVIVEENTTESAAIQIFELSRELEAKDAKILEFEGSKEQEKREKEHEKLKLGEN